MAILTVKRLARGVYFVWPEADKVILIVDAVPVASQCFKTDTVQLLSTATRSDRYYIRKFIRRAGGTLVPRIECPAIFHRED